MSERFRFPALSRDVQHQSMQQRLDDAFEKGRQQGFEQGQEQGEALARQALKTEYQQQSDADVVRQMADIQAQNQARLDDFMQSLKARLRIEETQLSEELYLLLAALSKTVLDAELRQDKSLYQKAIKQVLMNLQGEDKIKRVQICAEGGAWLLEQGITQIDSVPLVLDDTVPTGQVNFCGDSQLHLLSFSQRLDEALAQLRPLLSSADEC
ncbi:FliH/SctL family protein [Bowmanella pacifica]|uniref:Flagellar assembly protein FliH/Type III secretion system HrpE domain-containing protein n=1 Tax=Bowmanella pacifica TaxID=502051 RepID=A0A917YXL7_9ALTE|nr:FliH/SctL family protein [Bowmanella pacifica]GGO69404.1 hypothetical protein GCM10010982_20480 [Bowmanella pacifica]